MKVSKRTEYGLRALVTLAEQSGSGEHPVPLREIAALEDIPEAFLDQIFGSLRREGLVVSVRGATGGYLLAQRPDQIPMGRIVRILEGSLAPMGCVSDDYASPEEFCARALHCHTRNVWAQLNDIIERTLNDISLLDVMLDKQTVS